MTGPLASLRGIGRTFAGPQPVHALRDVDLDIGHGDYLAVMGPSGSGKSTLLNILGLLDQPDTGSYVLDGLEAARLSEPERAGLRAHLIGFVFQAFHLIDTRTVVDNVALGALYRGIPAPERSDRAVVALERVGLRDRLDFTPRTLSGGERQRVAIARALVGDPALLLCDEPTGNLDRATGESILELIDDLNGDGRTVVLITHDPTVAERSGRVVSMLDGRLAA